ncbi:MAG TPA: ABC transporter ATP-binding protein [Thermoanaerobaculaceae bacterium]|nr:ABC transporter ATP-binding protein [Thermoanaerobaculaceae bacterium]HPS78728.1 ABC transporter ATP-binding protein [Thermoanaerobaculaceae bacterium]
MTERVVVAHELSRTFGAFVAVDRVSFEVERGEVFGFLGSNGAGKTTTIRMLCGLLTPSSGRGEVLGLDIARQSAAIKQRIGYMSQRFSLYTDLTVDENLRFWGGTYGLSGQRLAERADWAVLAAGLGERRRTLVRELPSGFRQRLALGCALLHEPPIVFLDEPTGGVDPEARRRFWDLIDELAGAGTTVFVTTHYMDEAERCHRVALMHAGRLLALDSVPSLKRLFAPGSVVEVRCSEPAAAGRILDGEPAVREAALFGSVLHVVLADAAGVATVRDRLGSAGIGAAVVTPIEPSLEDVFIHVIASAEGAPSPGVRAGNPGTLGADSRLPTLDVRTVGRGQ